MTGIQYGQSIVKAPTGEATISIETRDNETWYRIANYDRMPPFLMTVVSAYDHWMYVSSSGGLTCGRRDPDNALFPYETDDRIHHASFSTGPLTALLIETSGQTHLWKPFSHDVRVYDLQRNLYKNQIGNQLEFEEINQDLKLKFTYNWSTGNRFGFIRTSSLQNLSSEHLRIRCLDGYRNLLPHGINRNQQSMQSTLLDAYKRAEKVGGMAAGIYSMSSQLTDRAEPNEALRATLVQSLGLPKAKVLLSEDQLDAFCSGASVVEEEFCRGKRGAFFVTTCVDVSPGSTQQWHTIADVDLGPIELERLLAPGATGADSDSIAQDVANGSQRLRQLVGQADGFQATSDPLADGRHFSNTLFNIMRGGVFDDGYLFPKLDFLSAVAERNTLAADDFNELLFDQGDHVHRDVVLDVARRSGVTHLERLALEYLPLKFSRRHGDPSRPWNQFSIDIRGEDGEDRLSYQGNWRDIFQNWEALAISYPGYLESFIAKFVNASTADGYNPYRINKHGIDWEVLEPDEPWSNIGYWGDHQVNYLVPLLEFSRNYHPGSIERYLHRRIFVFADVPYRIKGYQDLVRDPANTIDFDEAHARVIDARVQELGTDGKLLRGTDAQIIQVNLLEKLLLVALVRLGNLVPGGGIWMNTQRPEWNDANNALVGFGLSMVTLCYLRRYVALLVDLIGGDSEQAWTISAEVFEFFADLDRQYERHADLLVAGVNDEQRKQLLDMLGESGARYRNSVYGGLTGRETALDGSRVISFLTRALNVLDATIRQNERADGLYQAYNLIHFDADGYRVERLGEMLEGQVAVLNSGCLDPAESLALLDALKNSAMYRSDQNSYTLYPDKALPAFLEKNVINDGLLESNAWLQAELASGSSKYVEQDMRGRAHFKGRFRNVSLLRAELESDRNVDDETARALCEVYEDVFNHRAFTGRSGSMCKYEGLGCIYWHMVSKLLLATIEVVRKTHDADPEVSEKLVQHFDEIRAGLGLHKSPAEYGAFPTDPYSHTPSFIGVQQPGMTGQVKEDIIIRFRELGVSVDAGRLSFNPYMLRRSEFSESRNGTLAFSLCAVPVTYRISDQPSIRLTTSENQDVVIEGNRLTSAWSQALFRCDGSIETIEVGIPGDQLRT